MGFENIIILIMFPLLFISGKFIAKIFEDEIKETRFFSQIITKFIISLVVFFTINYFFNILISLIIVFILLIYLFFIKKIFQEKIILLIAVSFSVLYLIEISIILGLIAIFLKGLNIHEIGEHLFTKKMLFRTTQLFFMLSFKIIVINIIIFMI